VGESPELVHKRRRPALGVLPRQFAVAWIPAVPRARAGVLAGTAVLTAMARQKCAAHGLQLP